MSVKRRNPLGLCLPPTIFDEENVCADEEPSTSVLDDQLLKFGLSKPQKKRLNEWAQTKEAIQELSEGVLRYEGDLGQGNGGVVQKVFHKKTGIMMARKLVHLEVKPSLRQQIIKELAVLHKCNSPYIVGFYGTFVHDYDISICMEYMDGLSLDIVLKKVGRIPERHVGRICVAVVRGLAYLKNEIGALHRDVKPSNMLVNSKGEAKLCDFGVSAILIDSMAASFVGTRSYMAPERLVGNKYTVQSDIWSLGLSMVELLVGRYPVPPPTKKDYAEIFNVSESAIEFAEGGEAPPDTPTSLHAPILSTPAEMAIFEMLEYIANLPPPVLPKRIFSDEVIALVSSCLKKKLEERATLKSLSVEAFFVRYADADDHGDFASFVASTIAK